MMSARPKAVLIAEIFQTQKEHSCQCILKLLEMLINEIREENDRAPEEVFKINQGKIQGYLVLKGYIERGLPSLQ